MLVTCASRAVLLTENLDRLRNDVTSFRLQMFKVVRAEVTTESRRLMDRLSAIEVRIMERLDNIEVKVTERVLKAREANEAKIAERQMSLNSRAKVTYM